jgi:hypothetical protein
MMKFAAAVGIKSRSCRASSLKKMRTPSRCRDSTARPKEEEIHIEDFNHQIPRYKYKHYSYINAG